jgi:uncharacterized protein (DUF302 family)
MLANEMRNLSSVSRNENKGFQEQWEKMEEKIRETAKNGENYCSMVYGRYNEQLIEKLKENGFKVMRKMELFPHIPYGATNCMTHYVVW